MGLTEVDEAEESTAVVEPLQQEPDLRVRVGAGEREVLEAPRQRLLAEPVHGARAHDLVSRAPQPGQQVALRRHRHQRVAGHIRLPDLHQAQQLLPEAVVEREVVDRVREDPDEEGLVRGEREVGRGLRGHDVGEGVEHRRIRVDEHVEAAAVVREQEDVGVSHTRAPRAGRLRWRARLVAPPPTGRVTASP